VHLWITRTIQQTTIHQVNMTKTCSLQRVRSVQPMIKRQQSPEPYQSPYPSNPPRRPGPVQKRQRKKNVAPPAPSQNGMKSYSASLHKSIAPPAMNPKSTEPAEKVQSTTDTAMQTDQQAPADVTGLKELIEQSLDLVLGNPDVACQLAFDIIRKLDHGRQWCVWRRRFQEMTREERSMMLQLITNNFMYYELNRPDV